MYIFAFGFNVFQNFGDLIPRVPKTLYDGRFSKIIPKVQNPPIVDDFMQNDCSKIMPKVQNLPMLDDFSIIMPKGSDLNMCSEAKFKAFLTFSFFCKY